MTVKKKKVDVLLDKNKQNPYIVCVGASAGGLDALERFFKACPVDTGASFVVIQHLSPDHKSMMSNLLARHTKMPIILVEDDMLLEPNRLHLIPPGKVMHVSQSGQLHLTPKTTRGLTLPIDIFFSSMAEVFGDKAIGIILSGTGTDGTRGAEAIKAANGFLLAQDPESAKFDGMPRSVIATSLVDAILPPEDLPEILIAHIHNLPIPKSGKAIRIAPHSQMASNDVFIAILKLLHQFGGVDFADYKPATIMRRIERRMQIRHTAELYQYLELLENDHTEVLTLRKEMLISVTSFFRDPDAFETLSERVIAPMVSDIKNESVIRVWTAGVATGEEAYTLAMLFIEAFEKNRRWPNLKIFATDVDQSAIEIASAGQYTESAAADISPERLERFFVKKKDSFVIKNELRPSIVFARHNLLSDPPFTKMHLVVCRNTLIYFKSGAQERALRSLQYSVREGGVLLLGSSESLSVANDGMQIVDAKHKIFRRVGPTNIPFIERKSDVKQVAEVRTNRDRIRRSIGNTSFAEQGLSILMKNYTPPAVIVNDRHEIVHLFGDTSNVLRFKDGAANLELNRHLIDILIPIASALIYKAEREKIHLVSEPVPVPCSGKEQVLIRLSSYPLELEAQERMTLLCFEQVSSPNPISKLIDIDMETVARINMLEHELMATRENLQATIEELETSNEELQSLNEEMNTVNAEFQEKMLVLNRANADLDSMSQAAGVATIFVDEQMNITRFSPDAMQVFKLRGLDVGRKLDEISHILDYTNLIEDISLTLNTGRMNEYQVQSKDGKRIYLTRILPYIIPSTTLRGAVITFIDITAFHDAKKLQTIIDALPEHIAVLDPKGVIVMVNLAWRRFAQANDDSDMRRSGIGINYLDVCNIDTGVDANIAAEAVRGIRQVLGGSEPRFTLQYPCHSTTEKRWFVMNVAPVNSEFFGAVVSHINVTAWYKGTVE